MEEANTHSMEEEREKFKQVIEILKTELLEDPGFEYDDVSREWVGQMVDYNVPGGKLNMGLAVIHYCRLLSHPDQLSDTLLFRASLLGCSIQWLVGCALVLDDIMDDSQTRRGHPCWFRLPKVGMIAVNDGILLWNHIHRILKKHFRDEAYYVDLLDLFNEAEYHAAYGQMADLITTHEGKKDLFIYTPEIHQHISKYKTSYFFYVPFACALLILDKKLDDYVDVKGILLEMGIYFQVQDDYLDCFGDPEEVGKIGSDIKELKCSWLVVKALELCNEEQKKVLCDNYGKVDLANVAIVKSLYKQLNLQEIFVEYEIDVYKKLIARIEALPSNSVQAALKSLLGKIYKRQK